MNRKEANEKIIEKLEELVNEFPDQRFGQIIANYIFPDYRERDIFFEESSTTLNKLRKNEENRNRFSGMAN